MGIPEALPRRGSGRVLGSYGFGDTARSRVSAAFGGERRRAFNLQILGVLLPKTGRHSGCMQTIVPLSRVVSYIVFQAKESSFQSYLSAEIQHHKTNKRLQL
jgi:hypothetical protein